MYTNSSDSDAMKSSKYPEQEKHAVTSFSVSDLQKLDDDDDDDYEEQELGVEWPVKDSTATTFSRFNLASLNKPVKTDICDRSNDSHSKFILTRMLSSFLFTESQITCKANWWNLDIACNPPKNSEMFKTKPSQSMLSRCIWDTSAVPGFSSSDSRKQIPQCEAAPLLSPRPFALDLLHRRTRDSLQRGACSAF